MGYQAMVSRVARRELPPMEVLLAMEPRLKVRKVRTMDSHRAMDILRAMDSHQARGVNRAMESHRTMESYRVMDIPPATGLLLVAKMALARDTLPVAEVVRATSILRVVEVTAVLQATERAMGVRLATVRPAMGTLQATELTITPRPHLSHLH